LQSPGATWAENERSLVFLMPALCQFQTTTVA
jgi:hypothetical protein